MKNLIEQLKDNEKPFGLMSEEMQEKAREIGQPEFEMYMKDDTWIRCGGCNNFHSKKVTDQTYRLRPDYAEKPEIVECEIFGKQGHLHFIPPPQAENTVRHSLHQACDHPDFIGFKFEDGGICIMPIKYGKLSSMQALGYTAEELAEQVLHATHVLFRKTK